MSVQGPDEAYGNPVHLLWHPHNELGAVGKRIEQRTLLEASWGETLNEGVPCWDCYWRMKIDEKTAETTGMIYKNTNFYELYAE